MIYVVDDTPTNKTLPRILKERNISLCKNPERDVLADLKIIIPVETQKPTGDVVEEAAPIKIDGVWTQQWKARPFTNDEANEYRVKLKARVKERRRAIEFSGITVDGMDIDGTMDTKTNINWALSSATRRQKQVKIKAKNGWKTFSPKQISDMADAVDDFIAALDEAEIIHYDTIDNLSADKLSNYDVGAGWPQN